MIEWQAFSTLTFKTPIPNDRLAQSMIAAWLRHQCCLNRRRYSRLLSLVRGEFGEKTGRFHVHVLSGGLGLCGKSIDQCMALKKFWESLRFNRGSLAGVQGDIARVYPFNEDLEGVQYVMKGLMRYEFLGEAQSYEMAKFGLTDRVYFSDGVLRMMARRLRKAGVIPGKPETSRWSTSVLTAPQVWSESIKPNKPQSVDCEVDTAGARIGIDPTEARWLCQAVNAPSVPA